MLVRKKTGSFFIIAKRAWATFNLISTPVTLGTLPHWMQMSYKWLRGAYSLLLLLLFDLSKKQLSSWDKHIHKSSPGLETGTRLSAVVTVDYWDKLLQRQEHLIFFPLISSQPGWMPCQELTSSQTNITLLPLGIKGCLQSVVYRGSD